MSEKLISSAMFINAIPVCKRRNRKIDCKISLRAVIPTMRRGYIYGCCQTENGEYVYQGDAIRDNEGNSYRVMSLFLSNGGTVNTMDLKTDSFVSLPLNKIHGLCDFASNDSLVGKEIPLTQEEGERLTKALQDNKEMNSSGKYYNNQNRFYRAKNSFNFYSPKTK